MTAVEPPSVVETWWKKVEQRTFLRWVCLKDWGVMTFCSLRHAVSGRCFCCPFSMSRVRRLRCSLTSVIICDIWHPLPIFSTTEVHTWNHWNQSNWRYLNKLLLGCAPGQNRLGARSRDWTCCQRYPGQSRSEQPTAKVSHDSATHNFSKHLKTLHAGASSMHCVGSWSIMFRLFRSFTLQALVHCGMQWTGPSHCFKGLRLCAWSRSGDGNGRHVLQSWQFS